MAQRRQIGVVTGGNLRRVSDGEASEIALGLRVPKRFVCLAKAGEKKMKRLAVIIDNAVPRDPVVDQLHRVMADVVDKPARMKMHPQAIARRVLACR